VVAGIPAGVRMTGAAAVSGFPVRRTVIAEIVSMVEVTTADATGITGEAVMVMDTDTIALRIVTDIRTRHTTANRPDITIAGAGGW
jgi:hypothetical protein